MPNIDELANRNYAVSVTSHNGTVNYLRRMQLFFPTDAFGFLLIRTDKPIYKPDQVGASVCVCVHVCLCVCMYACVSTCAHLLKFVCVCAYRDKIHA